MNVLAPVPSFEELAAAWQHEKGLERQAAARRKHIEAQIIDRTGIKDEGQFTEKTEHFKITVKQPVNRKLNEPALATIAAAHPEIPAESWPVRTKHELDVTKWKALEKTDPERARIMAPAITSTPGSPSVAVEDL